MILLSLNYSPSPISLRLFSRSGKIENHESAISDLLIRLDSKFYLATRHQLFSKFGKTSKKESTWRPRATVLFFLLLSLSPCPSLFFSLSLSLTTSPRIYSLAVLSWARNLRKTWTSPKSLPLYFLRFSLHFIISKSTVREKERESLVIFAPAQSADKKHTFP